MQGKTTRSGESSFSYGWLKKQNGEKLTTISVDADQGEHYHGVGHIGVTEP